MKRVLADHNVPFPCVRMLQAFAISTAAEYKWDKLRNGELLEAAEKSGFQVLLTDDKSLRSEYDLTGRKIGLVMMSDNHWDVVRIDIPAIMDALHKCEPGQVLPVFCGEFVRRSTRKPLI